MLCRGGQSERLRGSGVGVALRRGGMKDVRAKVRSVLLAMQGSHVVRSE